MKIYIASDHAGFELKQKLIPFIESLGFETEDKGPFEFNAGDDYPDFIKPVAIEISKNLNNNLGIVLGGSGQGEAIICNRIKGVRAIVFYGPRMPERGIDISGNRSEDPYEIVKLGKAHNNANILSLGARFISDDEAQKAVRVFLETDFSDEERHKRRIDKIENVN